MANIVIKDLPESVDLDRQAMLAIMGGARSQGRAAGLGRAALRSNWLTGYPTGQQNFSVHPLGKPTART